MMTCKRDEALRIVQSSKSEVIAGRVLVEVEERKFKKLEIAEISNKSRNLNTYNCNHRSKIRANVE